MRSFKFFIEEEFDPYNDDNTLNKHFRKFLK